MFYNYKIRIGELLNQEIISFVNDVFLIYRDGTP